MRNVLDGMNELRIEGIPAEYHMPVEYTEWNREGGGLLPLLIFCLFSFLMINGLVGSCNIDTKDGTREGLVDGQVCKFYVDGRGISLQLPGERQTSRGIIMGIAPVDSLSRPHKQEGFPGMISFDLMMLTTRRSRLNKERGGALYNTRHGSN